MTELTHATTETADTAATTQPTQPTQPKHNYDAVNFDNIQKLANYLENLPPEYKATNYRQSDYVNKPSLLLSELEQGLMHPCGTNCCAAGHAPYADIGNIQEYSNMNSCGVHIDWVGYARDSLIDLDVCLALYKFAFSAHWPSDMQQAILRLKLILLRKVPEEFYYDNRYTEADLANFPRTD